MAHPPVFIYHPDPVGPGSIEVSDAVCRSCGQVRGFIYVGPVYALEELGRCICPWCIATGTAHAKLNASFTDEMGIGGCGEWDAVPDAVRETVAFRTPGFVGWQQEKWWTHCGDAAVFVGVVGYRELLQFGAQAMTAIAEESGHSGDQLSAYIHSLDRDGSPTAYLFQCRHCGRYGGYSDCD